MNTLDIKGVFKIENYAIISFIIFLLIIFSGSKKIYKSLRCVTKFRLEMLLRNFENQIFWTLVLSMQQRKFDQKLRIQNKCIFPRLIKLILARFHARKFGKLTHAKFFFRLKKILKFPCCFSSWF